MYSDNDLRKLVKFFRTKVTPKDVRSISDVTRYPNDIIWSYIVETLQSSGNIAEALMDFDELDTVLNAWSLWDVSLSELPFLDDGLTYDDPLRFIAASIENRTGKFAEGDGYSGNGSILIADKDKKVHRYPSGKKFEFYSLSNEMGANVPIFDMGYLRMPAGEIYVRDNSAAMMQAMAEAYHSKPVIPVPGSILTDFQEKVRGIVIAHELCEKNILSSPPYPEGEALELESERLARDFLRENGVNIKYYEAYHALRAVTDERGRCISTKVLSEIRARD